MSIPALLSYVPLKTLGNELTLEAIGLKTALTTYIERSVAPTPLPTLTALLMPALLMPNQDGNSPFSEEASGPLLANPTGESNCPT